MWNKMPDSNDVEKFKAIPHNKKAIFLPQCLRSVECKAKNTDKGIICEECGKCKICNFKKEAEKKGYNFFIAPGASLVMKVMARYKFEGVLGVACIPEIEQAYKQGKERIKKGKITPIAIQLLRDGCVNTDVEWEKLYEIIR